SADNANFGAAWVFTRSGGVWNQQGPKLIGSGAQGTTPFQGISVALSADGNTALIGGYGDNANIGSAWVFTRSGGTWTQQGAKLEGTANSGPSNQGNAVALSADGNTALIGGFSDGTVGGAAWVFTRSGSVWTQQGSKLMGSGNSGLAAQGQAVSLSADGNTALIGGNADGPGSAGSAWVFTRSGGVWTQQGSKLRGTGTAGGANQGEGVSLSADGNIALVGGYQDAGGVGAAWIFTRSGGVWTQQGGRILASGESGSASFGAATALSADGTTALIGGNLDALGLGAAWVFTQ
ncbi:MAG: hypothetical protein ACXVBW_08245, partial [Bdellovibrionota bacterium]